MSTGPELEESRRVTLAACALVACCQVAFGVIDLSLFGPVAAALDFVHAAVALVALAWLWKAAPGERGYELVFTLLAVIFLPAIFVSEARGAELGHARDPLVPLQFLMLGVAALAPGRAPLGATILGLVVASSIAFWSWLQVEHPVPETHGEPWMTIVYAGVAATLLALRVRRRAMMQDLATARAERDALARVARLCLAVRDQANTPLQTLEISTVLLGRMPDATPLTPRMSRALARLRDLLGLFAVTERWRHTADIDPAADLAHEVAEAARALEDVFADEAGDHPAAT